MRFVVIGFVWVVLALFVGTYTAPRRGTLMALVWGLVTLVTGVFGLVVWGIYMAVSGRTRPLDGRGDPTP